MLSNEPRCDNCGASCENGFEHHVSEPERDTGYSDDYFLCDLCLEEEGRWEAADAAYDLQVDDRGE